MDSDRFDLLTQSVFTISRRGGLVAGGGAILTAGLAALGLAGGDAKKKKKKRCLAGEQRCGRKCCGPGFACKKSDIKRKGENRRTLCAAICPANGGNCGETPCGNGGAGPVCRATVTTEGESFCIDFVKANPVACQSVCRRSEDCGPGGVCLCVNNVNNPTACSCGEGVETSCFVRADVECE